MLARVNRPATLMGLACLAAASLCAGACSTAKDPAITVTGGRVGEESAEGVRAIFSLEGRNDNEIELPLLRAEYTLEIDGRRVFDGDRAPEATLRRLGTQGFTLPTVVPIAPGKPRPTGVHPYRLSGSIEYVAPGAIAEALFDLGVRRPRVGFSGTGEIDFGPGPSAPTGAAAPTPSGPIAPSAPAP